MDATGFADFGFFLDAGAFVSGDDDFAEEPLVDAAERMNGDDVEKVGAIGAGKPLANIGEVLLVNLKVRLIEPVRTEDDAVVNTVEPLGRLDEIRPRG